MVAELKDKMADNGDVETIVTRWLTRQGTN
jgi:hypothetical protein